MSLTKHSYSGDTFDNLFDSFSPKEKKVEPSNLVKVASGCVDCPLYGKASSTDCNSCKFATGISFENGDTFIKCSSRKEAMTKEASSVQGVHWANDALVTAAQFQQTQDDIRTKVVEELKYAAHQIGVKLAQSHLDEFADDAVKNRLSGKKLEKAARTYVTKIEEKVVLPQRTRNAGKIDEVFTAITKNSKTILSGISETGAGDSTKGGGRSIGSSYNPNTIWNTDALTKAAQTPLGDEIIAKSKEARETEKLEAKASYWNALQTKLSEKGLVSNVRVHSTSTIPSSSFNSNLPDNAMGIFGDHKEFENLPEKTAGEQLAAQKEERETKKSKENSEVQIKAAKRVENGNWLFA